MTKLIVAFRNFVKAPKIIAIQTLSSASHFTFHRVRLFAIDMCASPFTVFVIGCDVLWNPWRLVQQITERSWQNVLCSQCDCAGRLVLCCVCLKCENGPHLPGALLVCSKCAARASAGAWMYGTGFKRITFYTVVFDLLFSRLILPLNVSSFNSPCRFVEESYSRDANSFLSNAVSKFYGNRRHIALSTTACRLSQCSASLIQSTPCYLVSLKCILILWSILWMVSFLMPRPSYPPTLHHPNNICWQRKSSSCSLYFFSITVTPYRALSSSLFLSWFIRQRHIAAVHVSGRQAPWRLNFVQ